MVNGFQLTSLTNKGRHGIKACMKANLKKEKISDDPLTVTFIFSRDAMKVTVKEADVIFFIEHMQGLVGKRDIDYKLEVF